MTCKSKSIEIKTETRKEWMMLNNIHVEEVNGEVLVHSESGLEL